MNVWRYGMSFSDWELCASFAGTDGLFQLVKRPPPFDNKAWIYTTLFSDLPAFFASDILFPGTGNFPWGYDVDPD